MANKKVSVKNLKKNFGSLEVLKDISLDINEGEVVCLIGPSGSGKSTFLRCLNRLEDITSGSVVIDGEDITDPKLDINKKRENIGMVFQHFNLFPHMTVKENIMLAPVELKKMTKEEAETTAYQLLDRVGLKDKADSYPAQLSGGQKQRVAIARALANNTEILLCDEPTSALDAETTVSVLDLLEKVNKELGVTIVIITHELDVVKRICGKVAVMDRGQVVEIGSVYKVFTKPESEFTKQLIANSNNFDIPESVLKNMEGDILELTYLGQNAGEAVLSEITAEYNVRFNILHGKIEYIGDKPLGILYVNLLGDKATRKKVKNILAEKVSNVEVLKNA